MRRLLSLIFLAMICFSAHAAGGSPACNKTTIHIGIDPSSMIYNGSDAKLPLDGCFLFSVHGEGLHKPVDINGALDQVTATMPHWMYNAVLNSSGNYRCLVRVNGRGYLYILMNLYITKWKSMGVNIDKLLANSGDIRDEPAIRLQELVCRRIKNVKK